MFISYSNGFFVRKRKNEVGLYALLGLRKRTIGLLLFYENLILGALVLAVGIVIGALVAQVLTAVLLALLGATVDIGMNFSVQAVVNTVLVFSILILFTAIQSYRLIYRYRLIELFRAEQEGEHEPRARVPAALLAVGCLVAGYWFAFQPFSNNSEILRNLSVMAGGIIAGTILLFSSLVIALLKTLRRNQWLYYRGMNLIGISNLVYRIKGHARTLSVISLLSAVALCAASVGLGLYHGFEQTARLTAPFSYMFVAQDDAFNANVDRVIRDDAAHPISVQLTTSVLKTSGQASSAEILSRRAVRADPAPIKIISLHGYNQVATALEIPALGPIEAGQAVAIRPMYTDNELSDYLGETITLTLPGEEVILAFSGMTVERVLNWRYPDIMIVVDDGTYRQIGAQIEPVNYVGYAVQGQSTAKETADSVAAIATPQAELSTFYAVYRLGIEDAALNVFILGFLALVFVLATGSIIYFKQLTEAAADKGRYEILKKVGVSTKDIRRSILQQNAFIFGLPLVVALAHYIAILSTLRRLFGGMAGVNLALPMLVCVVIFMFIYAAYYLITVNAVTRVVTGVSAPTARFAAVALGIGVAAFIGGVLWWTTSAPVDVSAPEAQIALRLPAPTGSFVMGTTELHLVDASRTDPWVPDRPRELMLSIWYPARQASDEQARYMPPGTAAHFDRTTLPDAGVDSERIDWASFRTNAWLDAPVRPSPEGWPVILYSPGGSVPRSFGTAVVEDLASRGYIVVTIDHTYETSAVEFPDGRVLTEQLPDDDRADVVLKMLDVRVHDVRYVLDQLAVIRAGGNPDAAQRSLPAELATTIDLSRIGIFGHSAGGATAAQAMYEDDRIAAGINMDGTLGYMPDHPLPVARHGLDRPFMLINAGYNRDGAVDSHLTAEDRNAFWRNSRGWKIDLSVPEGMHYTFTDYQVLLPALAGRLSLAPQVVQNTIGTVDPARILAAQRAYIAAFFDQHLKDTRQPLLDAPSELYPEVEFVE